MRPRIKRRRVTKLEKMNKQLIKIYNKLKIDSKHERLLNVTKLIIIKLVENVDESLKVEAYGSTLTRILSKDSDLDLTIICSNPEKKEGTIMRQIYREILFFPLFEYVEFIGARVPIIKGRCRKTGVSFDISYNQKESIETGTVIKQIVEKHPFIKISLILIKKLLKLNNLDSPFYGGVNSYILFNMLYAFHLYSFEKNIMDVHTSLMSFILAFLKFYGDDFNNAAVAINFIDKNIFIKRLYEYDNNFDTICILSMTDNTISISKSSFRFNEIKSLFRLFRELLIEHRDVYKSINNLN